MVPAIVAKRVKELRIWRDRTAQQLQVDPAIICTKALISVIAVQKPAAISSLSKMKEIKAWQVKEFGRDIINILNTVG
jgi:ribonuclease D